MENNKIIEFKNSNVIFSEKNLDMISSLIEDYGDVLDKNKDYTKLSLEFLELNDFFNDQLSPEDKKVFERLMSLNMDLRNYENTLAYFLGIKLIDDTRNL
ncbi:MAG: hypothetical protein IJ966_03095 [Bacilli bacterium]|nr:hypothetical protein [Bacilli bacterium]